MHTLGSQYFAGYDKTTLTMAAIGTLFKTGVPNTSITIYWSIAKVLLVDCMTIKIK